MVWGWVCWSDKHFWERHGRGYQVGDRHWFICHSYLTAKNHEGKHQAQLLIVYDCVQAYQTRIYSDKKYPPIEEEVLKQCAYFMVNCFQKLVHDSVPSVRVRIQWMSLSIQQQSCYWKRNNTRKYLTGSKPSWSTRMHARGHRKYNSLLFLHICTSYARVIARKS